MITEDTKQLKSEIDELQALILDKARKFYTDTSRSMEERIWVHRNYGITTHCPESYLNEQLFLGWCEHCRLLNHEREPSDLISFMESLTEKMWELGGMIKTDYGSDLGYGLNWKLDYPMTEEELTKWEEEKWEELLQQDYCGSYNNC